MRTGKKFLSSRKLYLLDLTTASIRIATLRGPSAVEMVKMMVDPGKSGDYDITVYDEPTELLGGMADGKLDFAVLPTVAAKTLRAKNLDYKIVATIIHGGLYICGTDRTITRINDLKGRTIHVMAGNTPPEMMLRHLIRAAGMEPETDVLFDRSHPTHKDLAEAAANGKTELCILSEPFVSQAVGENSNLHVLLDMAREWKKTEGSLPPVAALFCKGTIAAKQPETVKGITDELKRSCEWVKGNPEKAAEAVVNLGLFNNKKAIQASVNHSYFDVIPVSDSTKEIVDSLAIW